MVSAELDRPSGVVTFEVETYNPQLSAQIAQRLLDLLNRFNLETRQSQAAAERRFTEVRLAEAKEELLEVENRLQAFLEVNRDLGTSPLLRFRQERLEREVSIRQAVVSALAQNLRAGEDRRGQGHPGHHHRRGAGGAGATGLPNAPAPGPPGPGRRSPAGLPARLLLAFVRASRTDTADELDEFRRLKRATARDIRRPWRLLGFGRG